MASQPDKAQTKPKHCVYSGPAHAIPPEQRVKAKRFGHLDDPVIPRSYWYWTGGLVALALALGLLLGRFLLG
jgi:hypothetical protein